MKIICIRAQKDKRQKFIHLAILLVVFQFLLYAKHHHMLHTDAKKLKTHSAVE